MDGEWHVVVARLGCATKAAEAISSLSCVAEVYAPLRTWVDHSSGRSIMRYSPWLGSFVLARWRGDDPHAWHEVVSVTDPKRSMTGIVSGILGGWPPGAVLDSAVHRFMDTIQAIESEGHQVDRLPPPCAPGDAVRFTYLGGAFYHVPGHCVWVSAGVVGVRIRMLGQDQVIQVPYVDVALAGGVRGRPYGRRGRSYKGFTSDTK
jgi:hypothetical protein